MRPGNMARKPIVIIPSGFVLMASYEYGIGWLSDRIPEAIKKRRTRPRFEGYCLKLLREYKANIKFATGPTSPKEKGH